MLELRHIAKSYRIGPIETPILKDLSVTFNAAEVVSIMGGSGSGKTTFMNIVGLLDKPTTGEYRINGQDVLTANADALSTLRNRLVGFVFQSYFLLPRLSAWRNVALPLLYRGVSESEARRRAHTILDRVGLGDRCEHKPSELSGGQRQRVAIARALVGEPAVVLADEPTGALDPVVAQGIMNLFTEMNRELGVLVLIITHDHKVAAQCPRRVVLKGGRISEEADLVTAEAH
jgi:putative ABC transport system ATP-binding protein